MLKLLAKYNDQPTLANAQKLRAYERSHPMARCALTLELNNLLANAIRHANKGNTTPDAPYGWTHTS